MASWTATTTTTGKAAAEALAEAAEDAMEPFGVGVFEIEDGRGLFEVGLHFEEAPDAVALDLLAASNGARPFAVSEVPERDWVAHVRRELAPVAAGRFFVHGAHDADKVPDGVVPLLIEASMAFGTGHHGTTLGCLRAIDRLAAEGRAFRAIADVGCGTAVLAMAAATVWPDAAPVLAGDVDPVAVEVAEANVAANGLVGRVLCEEAAGFDGPRLSEGGPYDLVLANILKGPLIALAPAMARRIAPGGLAILSGLLTEQAESILQVYARAGFNEARREEIGDWTTLLLVRNAE
ncbi:50S ribosomal protein L11 methyltransferase [Wenxinia marina]|uniref:Ribosomal protein L11 methyltransferase n=1 Tax=Wenxinia marina DSM 24838 TaxID=1123501 RepID=A0A0D0Q7K0_9RHOB|nr:50S ribosomal protein L11 methyltransferase [Wenxinia marina]KIQ68437.1 [LSU ribosomal protein L11P]-lysine N-methyltransferase [Wenxinia marina DSM 24838]GGL72274.1 ribosomal protein L11 methyltransferase [Wenxinia marina]